MIGIRIPQWFSLQHIKKVCTLYLPKLPSPTLYAYTDSLNVYPTRDLCYTAAKLAFLNILCDLKWMILQNLIKLIWSGFHHSHGS